jgi:hypothetical protein
MGMDTSNDKTAPATTSSTEASTCGGAEEVGEGGGNNQSSSSSSSGKSSQCSSGIDSSSNSDLATAAARAGSSSNHNNIRGEMTINRIEQKNMHLVKATENGIEDKVARYKAENKKLRKELLLLRVKLEVEHGQDQEEHIQSSLLVNENADLRRNVFDLQEQCKMLQLQQQMDMNKGNEEREELSALQKKFLEAENELAEITQLKNAEIDVLRKQLNRAEEHLRNTGQQQQQEEAMKNNEREKSWNDERDGLRDEIRRLNLEVSTLKDNHYHHDDGFSNHYHEEGSTKEDDDETLLATQYINKINCSSNDSTNSVNIKVSSPDVDSLQSIITMMRQQIDESHHERDVLEKRLAEEIERSQMELQAFAKTLEGVDDLRKSAESMSREIRRIKVKGYRPTRSDLLMTMGGGGGGGVNAGVLETGGVRVRNFGDLTAAVEASESMENAMRLIESQNDSMEERRRAAVVVRAASSAAANATSTITANAPSSEPAILTRTRMSPIRDDEEEGGGFLSFWNNQREGGDSIDDDDEAKKKKKKSKRKAKRRDGGGGSVLTSFF